MPDQIPFVDQPAMEAALGWVQVVDALERALTSGAAPGNTPPRTFAQVSGGEFILMPAEVGPHVGVKVVSVSHGNATRGLPRIQGIHIAFDGETLRPVALLDAASLTLRRTAGLSALAIRHLAPPDARSLLVFGSGPQARSHVEAINAVRPLDRVVVVSRRAEPVAQLVSDIEQLGIPARAGQADDVDEVDLVACCTSASTPLFDSARLRPEATVAAMGSHDPASREVDTELVRRATVVVETRASALSQAGDIVLAIADGVSEHDAIAAELAQLASGEVRPVAGAPRLFKSVGEAWSDVVVASAVIAGLA